ncbi:DUF3320 domain-containing protein [Stenotrophomonas indicatrix]|uniref:DUF3320 domain-containing protein n=1 Tax=Stenotrophomonas indicatrix TaxID=2045451 RepID=UPI001CBB87CD|nr:DUF3320 domain-containing protein [Stenotrophomonas indicatrix]
MERSFEEGTVDAPESGSVLRERGSLIDKVNRARLELLDLSTRNRLLNVPRSGHAKTVEVVNELARAMYQTLVIDGKRFTFVAGRADPKTAVDDTVGEESEQSDLASLVQVNAVDAEADLALLEDEPDDLELLAQPNLELDEQGRRVSHWDAQLTTRLTPTGLQKRLLDLYVDARTLQEEQGINVLYLGIGHLKWRAPTTPKIDRYAPLVLVPVALERSNAGEKFHLRWQGDEIVANLSLQLFLQRQFEIKLPEIDEFESLDIDDYLSKVAALIEGKPEWAVVPDDAVLGLFSFAKFMMYRDLDPVSWEQSGGLEALPALRGVVSDGFPGAAISTNDEDIDATVSPEHMRHVVDSDSSQSLVVHDVLKGRSIVVQGPPGTGKSQTIANIIAGAIAEKKRVLFVAEKLAALEVVKRRLDQVRLGAACLELHSNKANKRALLEELRLTWNLSPLADEDSGPIVRQLTERRDLLNAHALRLHQELLPSKLTPYEVFGNLVRLRREGHVTARIRLDSPLEWAWDRVGENQKLLQDLCDRVLTMGIPDQHAWAGVENEALLPNDRDRLIREIADLANKLEDWRQRAVELTGMLDLQFSDRLDAPQAAIERAKILLTAPPLGSDALADASWEAPAGPESLIEDVRRAQELRQTCNEFACESALEQEWGQTRQDLSNVPGDFVLGKELSAMRDAHQKLSGMTSDLARLAQLVGEQRPLTFEVMAHVCALAERASSAPQIDRDALVARIWERGVDSVQDLVDWVQQFQTARRELSGVFRESAWSADLEDARLQIASRTGSFFRFVSGEWRAANRLVRAQLRNPKLPADQLLPELDKLLDAQAALRRVEEGNAQGVEAFGANWERDRSDTAFLRGVVAWMRGMRPLGLGAREQVAAIGDRGLAAELADRLVPGLAEVQALLSPIHESLLTSGQMLWSAVESSLPRVPLLRLLDDTAPFGQAILVCDSLNDAKALTASLALERIDALTSTQAALAALAQIDPQGEAAFGDLWLGAASDAAALQEACLWMTTNTDLRVLASRTADPQQKLEQATNQLEEAERLGIKLSELFTALRFAGNEEVAPDPAEVSVNAAMVQLKAWEADPEGLPQWVAYIAQANVAERRGLKNFVDALATGSLAPDEARGTFDLAYYEAVLSAMVARDPELATFDGKKQTEIVESFCELDRSRIDLARRQVSRSHRERIPSKSGAAGPVAVILGEMAKKRSHLPIRQLMVSAAPAIQALKPVFMMSPLSVAQFLPPGAVEFDLLVIDEASQVQPIDALGSIARAKQLVIVGDERQLPPTRFFSRALGDSSTPLDDSAAPADVESILGLCLARGLPDRMLQWHYRSRHQSLIAVSNSQFYENKLLIVPSPYTSEAGVGLRFHHLPDAVYDRGGTSTNAREARTVAMAVIAHAQTTPHLTLGAAAFSTQQRRAIFDEVELLRRQHPETEGFFTAHAHEPFFVKSLENIQGDERDVIFISIGYGRDARGGVSMNFGPVSSEGGERRLNVLISRAKSRCEIFSSITDEDIDLSRGKGKGTAALKLFLHYARTGRLHIASEAVEERKKTFEQEVAKALIARGYDLHMHVGVAGFFVDIAIADPEKPGRYVIGIECDGDSYRRSNGARDRDRLRDQALRDKGWQVHRVWSAEWFLRPAAELDALVRVIERSKLEPDPFEAETVSRSRAVPINIESVDHDDFVEVGLVSSDELPNTDPYVEANFAVPSQQQELHTVPAMRMAGFVRDLVHIEGPIHRSEVVVRIRSLWGLQRAGGRIQSAVDEGIRRAVEDGLVLQDGEFLLWPGRGIRVRDRSSVQSLSLRRPELLPPMEMDAAILELVRENLGATLDEVALHVSRRLGFRTTSAQLRAALVGRTESLLACGALDLRNGLVVERPAQE